MTAESVAAVRRSSKSERASHDAHIEQKTNVGLYSFFSAFLNAPETHANLDFVAVGAPVPRERRSFEWVG
jgi:hypothetical protein